MEQLGSGKDFTDSDYLGETAVGSGRSRTEGKQTHLRRCTDMVMPTHLLSPDVDRLLLSVGFYSAVLLIRQRRDCFQGQTQQPQRQNQTKSASTLQGGNYRVQELVTFLNPSRNLSFQVAEESLSTTTVKGPSGLSFLGCICCPWSGHASGAASACLNSQAYQCAPLCHP